MIMGMGMRIWICLTCEEAGYDDDDSSSVTPPPPPTAFLSLTSADRPPTPVSIQSNSTTNIQRGSVSVSLLTSPFPLPSSSLMDGINGEVPVGSGIDRSRGSGRGRKEGRMYG